MAAPNLSLAQRRSRKIPCGGRAGDSGASGLFPRFRRRAEATGGRTHAGAARGLPGRLDEIVEGLQRRAISSSSSINGAPFTARISNSSFGAGALTPSCWWRLDQFGVESTLRQAWESGFSMLVAEDLCASRSAEMHAFATTKIFPRLCRVVQSADLTFTVSLERGFQFSRQAPFNPMGGAGPAVGGARRRADAAAAAAALLLVRLAPQRRFRA